MGSGGVRSIVERVQVWSAREGRTLIFSENKQQGNTLLSSIVEQCRDGQSVQRAVRSRPHENLLVCDFESIQSAGVGLSLIHI